VLFLADRRRRGLLSIVDEPPPLDEGAKSAWREWFEFVNAFEFG
jgi:hypothetical protein